MTLDFEIPFWILALVFWLHLIATVVWLGGLVLMALVAWPAVRRQLITAEGWSGLRRRAVPWANGSLVILWVTGFVQMTADANYEGFLSIDSLWASAILLKHIAVVGMMGFGLYAQWRIHPALDRISLLETRKPIQAEAERGRLLVQENRLLRLNLLCAAAVLFFTAIATAI